MTRSSMKELFKPCKDPEQEFRSSRKHFKTLSLDESRSPNFDLFSNQEEYPEEEVAKRMVKTMEQYMSITRADYGSGVARPKIKDKDNFELKGQFLKELRTNTFSGLDHEDANEHIKKVLEIMDLFHIPNITIDQVMLRSFPIFLTGATSRWLRNKLSGASVSVMPLSTYLNLGLGELANTKLTVVLADRTMKYPKEIAENVLVSIGKLVFLVDFIILDMPEDIKVPLIIGRPFLSTTHAKIDVFKRTITLRVGEEKIIFESVKLVSSLIKRVYMLSLREIIELDLEAWLMGETLVLNRSIDPFFGDYIELNDLNVPVELRRDQVDDLIPTIEEVRHLRSLKLGMMLEREVGTNAKRFEGMITIHNGNEEVTYQMVRSHPRFKHHTNEQCNKIPLLLKVSKEDLMNGISYSYQKFKSFYKGVLNLGPEYVRDAKMEEWLTRGHISVHETK
nr:hypothetical protein [Tanacetum cinerariifolium]